MRLFLNRTLTSDKQTLGILYLLNDKDFVIDEWYTLELPNKNNQRRVSCIPKGTYKASKHTSPKHGQSLWLRNVPNRSEILIHKGNYNSDILGCILIGKELRDINNDGYLDVVKSKTAVKELLSYLDDMDSIMIEIDE